MAPLHRYLSLLPILLFAFGSSSPLAAQEEILTIYASPSGGKLYYQGKTIKTETLRTALKKIRAGSTILLLPGRYDGHFALYDKAGTQNQPMTVKGMGKETSFNCGHTPHQDGDPIFKIGLSKFITFENIAFENCWPTIFNIRESHDIIIKNLNVVGGQFVVLAEKPLTHDIEIHDSKWVQDPTTSVLKNASAEDVTGANGRFRALNGGFVVGNNVGGDFKIFNNEISEAFNAFKFSADAKPRSSENFNIYIHHNKFTNIYNGVVVADHVLRNFWFTHNTMLNAGMIFGLDSVLPTMFVFGNVASMETGAEKNPAPSKIMQLGGKAETDSEAHLRFYNNTFFGFDDFISGSTHTENLDFKNNILIFRNETKTLLRQENWHKSYKFNFNFSNLPLPKDFVQFKTSAHHFIGNLAFADPSKGFFQLERGSLATDRGESLRIGKWRSRSSGKAPDIGAYEGEELVDGPQFDRIQASYDDEKI